MMFSSSATAASVATSLNRSSLLSQPASRSPEAKQTIEMAPENDTDKPVRSSAPHTAASHAGPLMEPGSRIHDYVIQRFIASGGFGNIYQVEDSAHDRLAALKLLHPELRALGDSFIRFLREAQVLERIRHPNIIEVYDSGTLSDGQAFVVMELLSGCDLAEQIQNQGALSVESALEILEPVCDALTYSHAQGVIHRDIKASNVFLSESQSQRRIVLLDFGLAKLIEQGGLELTSSRMTIGTPSCMSPEQIRGDTVDARSDVYGLGALCFHMVTGTLPFAGKSETVMQYMHLHGQRPRPSSLANVSAGFDEVIYRAMASDRDDRYASPRDFLTALRDAARSAKNTGKKKRRSKHTRCSALAVYVDVRVGSESLDDAEDALLDAMDAILDTAEQHLLDNHFHIGLEGSSSTLYVRALNGDDGVASQERHDAVLAVAELARAIHGQQRQNPAIHVNLCMHCDTALVREGRIQGGDLMRLERWAPEADIDGVVGSAGVFQGLDLHTEPVDGQQQLLRWVDPVPHGHTDGLADAEHSRERLMHTQMMAQLGRQMAGIVHDLRSPLTVVLGNLEEVLRRLDGGEQLTDIEHRALNDAMRAAQQLKDITSNILSASAVKSYGSDRRKLSVCKLVNDAVKLSQGETRRKAAVQVNHQGDGYVLGSPGRLTQVMVNLLVNAAQAINGYGSIDIHTKMADNEVVEISIHDTGVGMSTEVKNRIFEPFFTTKDASSGTGLGLALVREIIEEHGGSITVMSTPGTGSCFTITLPAA